MIDPRTSQTGHVQTLNADWRLKMYKFPLWTEVYSTVSKSLKKEHRTVGQLLSVQPNVVVSWDSDDTLEHPMFSLLELNRSDSKV